MKGKVESIKVKIGLGSKYVGVLSRAVKDICCSPTTISRDMSGAKSKVTLFGISLEAS